MKVIASYLPIYVDELLRFHELITADYMQFYKSLVTCRVSKMTLTLGNCSQRTSEALHVSSGGGKQRLDLFAESRDIGLSLEQVLQILRYNQSGAVAIYNETHSRDAVNAGTKDVDLRS